MTVIDSFSMHLKNLRKEASLSQEALAEKVKTTRQTVANYEKGRSSPDIEILSNIKNYFKVDYEYLLGESIYKSTDQFSKLRSARDQVDFAISTLTEEQQFLVSHVFDSISNTAFASLDEGGIKNSESLFFEAVIKVLNELSNITNDYLNSLDAALNTSIALRKTENLDLDSQQSLLSASTYAFFVEALNRKEQIQAVVLDMINSFHKKLICNVMKNHYNNTDKLKKLIDSIDNLHSNNS